MIDRPPSTRRPLVLLGLLLLLLAPLFVPIPVALQQHPWISPLADRVHVALFAGLALLLHRWGPLRGRPWRVLAAVVVLGGLSELVQIAAGRSASLWDWFQDVQGAGLAGCWLWGRRTGRRGLPAAVAAAIVASILWPLRDLPLVAREATVVLEKFPVLSDFERPREDLLWSGYQGGDNHRVARPDGGHALRLVAEGDERWPGTVSRRLAWDWTGQDTLLVDARLVTPSPDSVRVTIWLLDRRTGHDKDQVWRTWTLGHAWTTLRLPLSELRTERRNRPLALQTIQALAIFMHRRDGEPLAMEIDDVRLVPGG